jgi:hypothetical protein
MNRKAIVAVGLSALLWLSACGGTKNEPAQVAASAEKVAEPAADPGAPSSTETTAAPVTSTTATLPSDPPLGPTGPTDAVGPSDADFIAAGNALCAKFNAQAESVAQPTDPTPAAVGGYLDSLLALFRQQVGELRALPPSPGLAGPWTAILTTLDAEGAEIESAVARLKAGDASAMRDIGTNVTEGINSQFDAIGMTTCGSESGE